MHVDLKELFSGDKPRLELEYSFSMSQVQVDGYAPFVSPVNVKACFKPFAEAVELEAELSYDFSMPCNRCMEETITHCRQKASHALVRSLREDEGDSYILVEGVLDLDELLYSDIILELPSKYICKEDCKGLCPQCGANLNSETCNCSKSSTDPRLEALKALLEN